jgi:hypothetical protein
MKKYLLSFFICIAFCGFGQIDTLNPLTAKQIADSVFGNLNQYIPTQKLYNRLLFEDTSYSIAWNTHHFSKDSINYPASSDNLYGLIYELKSMSIDTSTVEEPLTIFKRAQEFTGAIEFEEHKFVYPIGIVDFNYNYLDKNSEISYGNLTEENQVLYVNNSYVNIGTRKANLIAPMYDFFDSDSMGIVFKTDFFFSNYRSSDEISSIEITNQTTRRNLQFNEIFYFKTRNDSVQKFEVEVIYNSGEKIAHHFVLQTPGLKGKILSKSESTLPGCTQFLVDGAEEIDISGNKISWCLIPRCDYNGRIMKPYFLLTGYRPPILEQSFETTWEYYNDEHGDLLNSLIANNYDVFIVRFNIHARPFSHGMIESAELLMKFIEEVNAAKNTSLGHENILQGSSMSADIARLTLLTMEKKHLEDDSYPHHHSRLNIAYDANYYGANLPLSYQYQIISHVKYPAANILGIPGTLAYQAAKLALSLFLYSSLEQKAMKQLLQYHALASDDLLFTSPFVNIDIVPSMHPRRQEFYDALNAVDNGVHIFPMPIATRNISISLGKIKDLNSYNDARFLPAGANWRNINLLLWRFKLSTAKYTPPGTYTNLFIRRKTAINFWSSPFVHHKVNVSQMLEVDNAAGSYLPGAGNLIQAGNWAYFPINASGDFLSGENFQFSHKSVVTALGINRNLWPSNGSMTLDMQQMGLMNINKLPSGALVPSSNYGYPNLGRPNDHFQVTPFEAIYVDNLINPHIRYVDPVDAPDVPFVNDFLANEIEPWYLGLQNNRLGSTARANYTYHSYRRAKHQIVVGHLVTPTTDPGDYVVEANADLTLKAGDFIHIKEGVHFKAGSIVHIVPEYDICNDSKRRSNPNQSTSGSETSLSYETYNDNTGQKEERELIFLFPNPANDILHIKTSNSTQMQELQIYNLMGRKLMEENNSHNVISLDITFLEKGSYIIQIRLADNSIQTKQFQKL